MVDSQQSYKIEAFDFRQKLKDKSFDDLFGSISAATFSTAFACFQTVCRKT